MGSSWAGAEGSCYIFEFTAHSKMAGSAACSLGRDISVGRRSEEGTGCTATSLSGVLGTVTDTSRFECTDMAVGVRRLMTQLTWVEPPLPCLSYGLLAQQGSFVGWC